MNYKFAICCSSYKRFDNMQLQIYQMLHQKYDNFHVFVACKGISEYNFNKYIKPQYQKYIDEGKLTIRHFPNKNQFSNFFDTIRGLNIEGFDYFCKIDDDDLYSPNYIKTYNELANKFPNNNFFYRKPSWRLVRKNYKGFVSLEFSGDNVYMGPTLCMLKSLIKKLREAEESISNLKAYIEKEGLPDSLLNCGFIEDRLFNMSMKPALNIAPLIEEENSCVNFSNASTTRQGFLLEDFRRKNNTFSKNPDYYEHILTLRKPNSGFLRDIYVFNKKARFLSNHICADVKEFSDTRLSIEWNNGKIENFQKSDDGAWILA